jgi:hypothetical protein
MAVSAGRVLMQRQNATAARPGAPRERTGPAPPDGHALLRFLLSLLAAA